MVPKEPNLELLVYNRKKTHQKSREPTIAPKHGQSKVPSDDSLNIQGTQNSNLPAGTPIISDRKETPSQVPINLNIPIAIRKETRTCTKHPLAKYLSYDKLSHKHRALLQILSLVCSKKHSRSAR